MRGDDSAIASADVFHIHICVQACESHTQAHTHTRTFKGITRFACSTHNCFTTTSEKSTFTIFTCPESYKSRDKFEFPQPGTRMRHARCAADAVAAAVVAVVASSSACWVRKRAKCGRKIAVMSFNVPYHSNARGFSRNHCATSHHSTSTRNILRAKKRAA